MLLHFPIYTPAFCYPRVLYLPCHWDCLPACPYYKGMAVVLPAPPFHLPCHHHLPILPPPTFPHHHFLFCHPPPATTPVLPAPATYHHHATCHYLHHCLPPCLPCTHCHHSALSFSAHIFNFCPYHYLHIVSCTEAGRTHTCTCITPSACLPSGFYTCLHFSSLLLPCPAPATACILTVQFFSLPAACHHTCSSPASGFYFYCSCFSAHACSLCRFKFLLSHCTHLPSFYYFPRFACAVRWFSFWFCFCAVTTPLPVHSTSVPAICFSHTSLPMVSCTYLHTLPFLPHAYTLCLPRHLHLHFSHCTCTATTIIHCCFLLPPPTFHCTTFSHHTAFCSSLCTFLPTWDS